jgi:hypothetical protein
VLVAVLGLGVWGFVTLASGIINPWGSSLTGGPTLTGYWGATVSIVPGQERQVAFQLNMLDGGDCFRCVDGDGKMCGTGYQADYDLSGHVQNYHGTKFELGAGMATNVPGTHLGQMKGTWAGGDEVEISTLPHVVNADRATHSDEQPTTPIVFKMHRIAKADFQAACA